MIPRSYRWLFVSLFLTGLVADLVSKYVVFRELYPTAVYSPYTGRLESDLGVIPKTFRLHVEYAPTAEACDCYFVKMNGPVPPHVNHGALFGLGSQHTKVANGFFLGVSVVAAGAILFWGTRPSTRRDGLLSAALGLILGGTLGNLYDRIVFGGVRDFLYFYLIDWPVFNIADCCLVVGAGMLLVHALFVHDTHAVVQPSNGQSAEAGETAAPNTTAAN